MWLDYILQIKIGILTYKGGI